MENLKITIALIVAVILQWTLRSVAEPFAYIDFPLIIVVYAALQRNALRAIFFGTFAGIAVDALSGGPAGCQWLRKNPYRIYGFGACETGLHGQPFTAHTRHSGSMFAR
jgi:hypothetical protein